MRTTRFADVFVISNCQVSFLPQLRYFKNEISKSRNISGDYKYQSQNPESLHRVFLKILLYFISWLK